MSRRILLAVVAAGLSGCGGYFDQHPANVRPESEAVTAALGRSPQVAVAEAPVTTPTQMPATSSAPAAVEEKTLAPPPAIAESPRTPSPGPSPQPVIAAEAPRPVPVSPPLPPEEAIPPTLPAPAPPVQPAPVEQQVPVAPAIAEPPPAIRQAIPEPSAASPVEQSAPVPAAVAQAAPPPETNIAPPPMPSAPAVLPNAQPVVTATAAQAAVMPPQPAAEIRCRAVAKQRAADTAASGLDRDTQKIVRDGTYANCMSWLATHPSQ